MDPATLKNTLAYLEKLAACETAVADFYGECLSRWPDEEIWGQLVPQEMEHAALIRKIGEMVSASPSDFIPARPLSSVALDLFISAAGSYRNRVNQGRADKVTALSLSLDIERSIIEAKYETILSSSSKEYNDLISRIVSDTAKHRALFHNRVGQIKFRK